VILPPFLSFGVMENKRFISMKMPESRRALPLKLHHLCKCANTNKCSPLCARVLAFSQSFSLKELVTQLATPLDSSKDAKLDHSSGIK
jgi:hypothetical protein